MSTTKVNALKKSALPGWGMLFLGMLASPRANMADGRWQHKRAWQTGRHLRLQAQGSQNIHVAFNNRLRSSWVRVAALANSA